MAAWNRASMYIDKEMNKVKLHIYYRNKIVNKSRNIGNMMKPIMPSLIELD